ncbi:MAG: PilT protein-like protein [Rickettsiaceae bacterium]|jgi:predicted nucleic acid-binding protein|nr:PilT protein-like protein [Rickettsiaceae bacterium]
MNYLLDTNIISELVKANPNKNLKTWLSNIPSNNLYLSVLTLGEIRKGLEGIKDYARKEKIRLWLEQELPLWFNNRILPIDLFVADRWGRMLGEAERPLPAIDSLIAATALHYDLIMVTRNIEDFDYPGLEVINPWEVIA